MLEKAKEADMEQITCVDLQDRAATPLLALKCTRLRSALIQPEIVFLEKSYVLFFLQEMKRSLFPSLKGFILAKYTFRHLTA